MFSWKTRVVVALNVLSVASCLLCVEAACAEDAFCPDLQQVIDDAPNFHDLRGPHDSVPDMYVSKMEVPNGRCEIITRPPPPRHECVWMMTDEQKARATSKVMENAVQMCFGDSFLRSPMQQKGSSSYAEKTSFTRTSDGLAITVVLRHYTTKDKCSVAVQVESGN